MLTMNSHLYLKIGSITVVESSHMALNIPSICTMDNLYMIEDWKVYIMACY